MIINVETPNLYLLHLYLLHLYLLHLYLLHYWTLRRRDHKSERNRRVTEVSQTTIADDAINTAHVTMVTQQSPSATAYLTNLQLHTEQCNRIKMKDKVATESVVILGSYFTITFGSFIVLQYFMPVGFYLVSSETKYNTLLLIQLLLLLNSTLNPLVHYWRNRKIRAMVNGVLHDFCRALFTGPFGGGRRSSSNKQNNKAADISSAGPGSKTHHENKNCRKLNP